MRNVDESCPGAWDSTGAERLLNSTNQTCYKIQCVQQLYEINYFNNFLMFSQEIISNDSLFKFSRL